MSQSLARFAWSVLVYNVAVILWGAYVRATGSGAGCGSHWPLCNGEVIPRSPSVDTLIEYSHRLTSGLALIGVVVLLVWVWRATTGGHPARRGAAWSMVFMLTEAAVGAGLVLFELVADNASLARALFMGVHLLNTFLLLAALSLTAWWTSGGPALAPLAHRRAAIPLALLALGLLLVSSSGAIAALGDTLYPSSSLSTALQADLSPTSHVLIRLRALHPLLAVAIGLGVAFLPLRGASLAPLPGPTRWLPRAVRGLALFQIGLGFLNVVLLAPVWMQIVHLLVADLLWIAFVLYGASLLPSPAPARQLAVGASMKMQTSHS